jgi:hypothetical protein
VEFTNKSEELGYGLLLKELENSNSANVIPLLSWFKSHQVDELSGQPLKLKTTDAG